jgi:hypothetical protein
MRFGPRKYDNIRRGNLNITWAQVFGEREDQMKNLVEINRKRLKDRLAGKVGPTT